LADSRIQLEIEDWIRNDWLPNKYGQKFRRERFKLNTGGVFDFDAVSDDEKIVINISTSSAFTFNGKVGVGKMQKIHSDIMFLLMVETREKVILLTEKDMYDRCISEKNAGRIPKDVSFMHVNLPEELKVKLRGAKKVASLEVTPSKNKYI
jgi:hypothetical protein